MSVRVAKKSGEDGAKFTSTFSGRGLKDKVCIVDSDDMIPTQDFFHFLESVQIIKTTWLD